MARLPDEFVQELLDRIDETGKAHARAKAKVVALAELRKITKAQLMQLAGVSGTKGATAQERDAYLHPQYKATVDAWVKAIEDEGTAAVEHSNAEREFDAWRSLNANERVFSRP